MRPVLIRRRRELETVEALQDLLTEAQSGLVVGIAFVAIRPGREYSVGAAGEARRQRTFTVGAIRALVDALVEMPPPTIL